MKAQKFLKDKFFLTYGDGLSNINFEKQLKFHNKYNEVCTLTGINPPQRFGVLEIKGNYVQKFSEKKSLKKNFVSGGFFICSPSIFKFLKKTNQILKKECYLCLLKRKIKSL